VQYAGLIKDNMNHTTCCRKSFLYPPLQLNIDIQKEYIMLRIIVINLVLLLIRPGLLHSQTVPFISFNVEPGADRTVLFQWRVTPEADTLYFEVERGRDKGTWERIAHVAVQESHQYSSTDPQPGEGLIYYRVRQVGSGERYLYTQVKWVQISKTGELYIWPNPAKNILHVKTPFVKGSMDVVNPEGKLMLKISVINFITDVPTARLSKGIYFLHVRYGNEILVEKFVKE